MSTVSIRACERSGKRSGASRNPTGAERSGERGSKNQVERELSVSGRSSEHTKSAAQNPLHHKTTRSKKFKIEFKSCHKTAIVSSLLLSLLCRE